MTPTKKGTFNSARDRTMNLDIQFLEKGNRGTEVSSEFEGIGFESIDERECQAECVEVIAYHK